MIKLSILIALFLGSTSFAADAPSLDTEEAKPISERTGLDLFGMMLGVFGSKALGIDKNLLESGIDLHDLNEEMKRYEAREKLSRNTRIEAEMSKMPEKLEATRLQIASTEKYRRQQRLKVAALRAIGVAAALDFFIFDNTSVDTQLLRNTQPKTISVEDESPTRAVN
jgi:hypothetical protein